MVNVACEKCGSRHSLEEASIPPSGKVIKCPTCTHPITVMPPGAAGLGAGRSGGAPPPIPSDPRRGTVSGFGADKLPKIPSKKSTLLGSANVPPGAGGDGPKATSGALGDVPLPKRPSPLAGAVGGPKPPARSALAGVGGPGAPAPKSGLSAAGSDEIVDLPAPKRPSDILDLPAPKRPSRGVVDDADLPAPVGPTPTRSRGAGLDLPAPKGAVPSFDDDADLPAPVGPTPTRSRGAGLDLPTPVGPTPTRGGLDLPTPVGPTPTRSRGAGLDLPTPVGPTPTRGGLDLPAPKGFFDDAPDLPAPKSPSVPPDLPAPKPGGARATDLPAPKGFFDDVPAPKPPSSPPAGDLPAPKGFFDDIPAPAGVAPSAGPASGGAGMLDLDDLDLEPSRMAPLPTASANEPMSTPSSPMLDLDDPDHSGGASPFAMDALELDGDSPSSPAPAVPLELDEPDHSGAGNAFDDIELAQPTSAPPPTGVVTFSTPKSSSSSSTPPTPLSLDDVPSPSSSNEAMSLELAAEPARPKGTIADEAAAARQKPIARARAADEARAAVVADTAEEAEPARQMARGRKLAIAAGVFVLLAGAGGFFMFQKWQASKDRDKQIKDALALARRHIAGDQWTKAAGEAQKVLAIESSNAEALGLASQGYFAAAIDDGVDAKQLVARGEKHFQQINSAAATGVEVDKAKGLRALTERNPAQAIKILGGVAKKAKGDPTAQLYLGWAHMQAGDPASAAKAFAAVAKKNPKRVSGLYGLGLANIELGQVKEARAALLKVTELDKTHIGAQVGIAQIAEVDRFNDRENRYLEILNAPDIDKKDPRAVSRAWSLAGDEALRAGRIDGARARYAKALELDPDNVGAQIGDGKTSLAQGRFEAARERLKVALQVRPTHVGALIAYGEASTALDDWDGAFDSIQAALKLQPDNWRALFAYGKLHERYPDAEKGAAEDIYRQAMAAAGPTEIEPTVALSRLLVDQGRGPEALEVLRPIEAAAEKDAPLAVTLGVAYLGSRDPVRAEKWFRKALERRPEDVEAQLQLGIALAAQNRVAEAIKTLTTAYTASEEREDIGVRLAIVYEQFERDDDADKMYAKLLAQPGASLNVRGRAGRFYARTGRTDKAVTLGESILSENDRDAAGHFLRAEGLYAAGEFAEAQKEYRNATFIDPQAQYYEGLGRAAEKQSLMDEALGAFERAIGLDGKYLAPRIGKARIRVARHEYSMALDELEIAKGLEPDNAEVWFYIGECLYETDQDKEAARAYGESLRHDPKNAYAHYRLGRVYVDLDRRRDATGALKTATTLAEGSEDPWLADAYYYMGMSARAAGNSSLAIKGLRSFIDLAPDDARVRDAKKLLLRLEAGGK